MTEDAPTQAGDLDAVVFDCGGTLVHLVPSREQICSDVLKGLGIEIELDAIRQAYDLMDEAHPQCASRLLEPAVRKRYYSTFNTALATALGIASRSDELNPALQKAFATRKNWAPLADVESVLTLLGGRTRLFVLANWDSSLSVVLDRVSLLHHFEGAYDSQTLGADKPAPSIFQRFTERAKVDACRSVYVGNEYLSDVVGARRAGFQPILFDDVSRYPDSVDCRIVRSYPELGRLLGV